jgi:hypothetical protein
MFDCTPIQPRHLRIISGEAICISFSKAIIVSHTHGRNFLLTNVGCGLFPGPISTFSSSSADVNPYVNFPSSDESTLQMDKEDNKKNFGRSLRLAALFPSLFFETLQ